jgi:hypothetical protein
MFALPVRNKRPDAHNSMVDVLWKFVAEFGTNVGIRPSDKSIRGCIP